MNKKFSWLRLAATLATGALATAGALAEDGPQAEAGSAPPQTSAAPAARHCVAELAPVTAGARTSTMKQGGCYPTFAAAMAAATDNTVSLSSESSPESVGESDLAAAATRVIGIDYDGSFYSGSSYIWYARNSLGCYGGLSYTANMPWFFNNRLSSTRGFNGCTRNTSYSGYFQTGFWVRCFPNCLYVGDFMNNQTSSKRWTR
jgi:hypothetical protein